MRFMKALALIAGLLTAPQAMAAYGGVTLGQDQTTPTATPVCVMYGTTCKAQIGTYNGSTGVWTLPSGFNLPGVGPLGAGVGPALGLATNVNGGFPTVSVSATAPSTPSLFQPWLNMTATPYVWNIWDGASWVALGTINATTHAIAFPTLNLAAAPSGGFGGVSGNLPIANMPSIAAGTFLCNLTVGIASPTACPAGAGVLAALNAPNAANGVVTENGSGFIGIGTSTPNGRITASGAGQTTGNYVPSSSMPDALVADDTGVLAGSGGALVFSANSQAWKFAAIKGYVTNGGGNSQGDIVFSTRRNAADAFLTEIMRLKSTGVVNIATFAAGLVQSDGVGNLSSSLVIPNGATATTQAATDDSTKVATTDFVRWSVPIYDARLSGVKCDGVTDDSANIVAAITAASSKNFQLARVALPAGTCIWGSFKNILVGNWILEGHGIGATTIVANYNGPLMKVGSLNYQATFTASVAPGGAGCTSGSTMTVTAIASGSIPTNSFLGDTNYNVPISTVINSQLTGTAGSTGTYCLSAAGVTAASQTMYSMLPTYHTNNIRIKDLSIDYSVNVTVGPMVEVGGFSQQVVLEDINFCQAPNIHTTCQATELLVDELVLNVQLNRVYTTGNGNTQLSISAGNSVNRDYPQGVYLLNSNLGQAGQTTGVCLYVANVGGLVLDGTSAQLCGVGMFMASGNGNQISGVQGLNGYFDTNKNQALLVQPTGTGVIRDVDFTNFAWTHSAAADCVYISATSAQMSNFKQTSGEIAYCQNNGANLNNVSGAVFNGVEVHDNSLAGSGLYDGMLVNSGADIQIYGGHYGARSPFTQLQNYGIRATVTPTNLQVLGVNANGNVQAAGCSLGASTGLVHANNIGSGC